MPVLIFLAMIAVLVLWRLWARVGQQASLGEFRCQSCGVTAYSRSASGPRECKRQLRGGL